MVSFGKRLRECRDTKEYSQQQLGKLMNTSYTVIGKYERDEMNPSIEVAKRIAVILEVSLDFLTGQVSSEIDKSIVDTVMTIQNLPADERERILFTINALVRDAKSRFAYA